MLSPPPLDAHPCAPSTPWCAQENLESVHVPLTAEDLEVLDKLNVNMRFNDPINFWGVDIHA